MPDEASSTEKAGEGDHTHDGVDARAKALPRRLSLGAAPEVVPARMVNEYQKEVRKEVGSDSTFLEVSRQTPAHDAEPKNSDFHSNTLPNDKHSPQ